MKLILFGAGDYGKRALDFYGVDQVECFVDNDLKKAGKSYFGKRVISFEDYLRICRGYKTIISTIDWNFSEISNQLEANEVFLYDYFYENPQSFTYVKTLCEKISRRLGDEISSTIFAARTMSYLTGNMKYIQKMVSDIYPDFGTRFVNHGVCGSVVYGIGSISNFIRRHCVSLVSAFADASLKDMTTDVSTQLCVYPLEHVASCASSVFLIPYMEDQSEYRFCLDELKRFNISDERVIDMRMVHNNLGLSERIYFDLPYTPRAHDEVFVDAGCFNGYTTKQFLKWAGSDAKYVYAFEPIIRQYVF